MKVGNRSWFISFSHMTGAKRGRISARRSVQTPARGLHGICRCKGVYVLRHEKDVHERKCAPCLPANDSLRQYPIGQALALQFGLELLKDSDILLICGNRISSGMRGEIAHAIRLKMPMIAFDEGIYLEVQKELTKRGCDKRKVRLDRENFLMGISAPLSYLENAAMFR